MIKSKQNEPIEQNLLAHDPWEAASLRFESPEQDIRNVTGRLKVMAHKMAAECKNRGVVLWKGKWVKSTESPTICKIKAVSSYTPL